MELQGYMIVQIVLLVGVVLFVFNERKYIEGLPSKSDRNLLYVLQLIIFIGVLLRSVDLAFPYGVYSDEGICGYEAWCLANYGVDQNLLSWPVYFRSTGTGQSVLYAYLAVPFIKLFGLSSEVFRLPMSLIGSFVLVFFYWTLRKIKQNPLLIFSVITFLVICPWHIIKSRYAIDCNIFPDFLLIGICFVLLGCYEPRGKQSKLFFIAGFAIMGISAYGYGVSWFMLPFLFIYLAYYLLKNKKVTPVFCAFLLALVTIIAFPLVLFALNLATGGESASHVGIFTIPVLDANRADHTTLLGSDDIAGYIKAAVRLITLGYDALSIEAIYPHGFLYNIVSLPFFVVGVYYAVKDKNPLNRIFLAWLVSCVVIVFFVYASVWHWNAMWFPVIYFIGYGIYRACLKFRFLKLAVPVVYALAFVSFLWVFATKYNPFYSYTYKDEVEFAASLPADTIYTPLDFPLHNMLFYYPVDPSVFDETKYNPQSGRFIEDRYANVVIGLPEKVEPRSKFVYIVPSDMLGSIKNLDRFKVRKGKYHFSVLWND